MKTREQLYRKEAASLLRDITTYHCAKGEQLKRLYRGKEEKIEHLLGYLVKQGRIFYDTKEDIYYDLPDMESDEEMLAALWVLADFGDRYEYHSSDTYPTQIIFFAKGETYEIICLPKDKAAMVLYAVNMRGEEGSGKRIFIVEDTSLIAEIQLEGAIFCTVDADTGEVQYYKKE